MFDKIEKHYENNPIARGLIQLIPLGIGSAIDTSVTVKMNNMRRQRCGVFISEFLSKDIELSKEITESDDFVHCYFSTLNAVINTRRNEKIKTFARLLKSSFYRDILTDVDEYEEYINILEDLSYRELLMLIKLEEFESKTHREEKENDLQHASKFWDEYSNVLSNELLINKNEIESKLTRLERSGCYETFRGAYFDYTGGKGKTTYMFRKLKSLIQED